MLNNILNEFDVIDFPKNTSAVYIILFVKNGKEIPLYIGQTKRLYGRIGDYGTANFTASTDFKVGEAIKYLWNKEMKVIIRFSFSEDRKKKETEIIKILQSEGYRLLNELKGYKYENDNENVERERVRKFCDNIINSV